MTEEINEINESELIEQAARKQMAIEAGIQQETNVVQVEEEPTQEEPTISNETINAPIQKTTEELIQELRDENSKLRKGIDKTNGTYGNEIKKLKDEIKSLNKPIKSKPFKLDGLSIDNPAFTKIKEDYPELGQAIIDGMRQALAQPEEIEEEVEEKPTKKEKVEIEEEEVQQAEFSQFDVEMAMRELKRDHPDFDSVARFSVKQIAPGLNKVEWRDKSFGDFVESLDEYDRNVVMHGESPSEILQISEIIGKYKRAVVAPVEEAPTPPAPKEKTIHPDLRKAILPTGKAPANTQLTEDEIIERSKALTMKLIGGIS